MSRRNTPRSYGSVTKFFHWLTALLILTTIPLGLIANALARNIRNPDIAVTDALVTRATLLFSMHKTLGVAIFAVALLRILWALSQPKPGLLNAGNRAEAFLASTVHWLLYGALVLVPLTGWMSHAATTGFAPIWWPFGQSLPGLAHNDALASILGALHRVLGRVLMVALALHVAGALKHHLIDGDATLRRMLPGPASAPVPPEIAASSYPAMLALIVLGAALAIGNATGSFKTPTLRAPMPELRQTASDWQVQNGTLGLTITQLGRPVTGRFADWTAAISFDAPPAPGPAGSVTITVNMSSLTLGSVSNLAGGPDYLDIRGFPIARFDGHIDKTATGYTASGPLSLRGITRQISFPFTLSLDGDNASMSAQFRLDRRDFGIGALVSREQSLAFAVDMSVTLNARRTHRQPP